MKPHRPAVETIGGKVPEPKGERGGRVPAVQVVKRIDESGADRFVGPLVGRRLERRERPHAIEMAVHWHREAIGATTPDITDESGVVSLGDILGNSGHRTSEKW